MSYEIAELYKKIVRVDLAGEKGACYIYAGQIWASALRGEDAALLARMYEQEVAHVKLFEDLKAQYGVRPTLWDPLWKGCGWGLGVVTTLTGMAMTCTEAIEEVIEDHYGRQIDQLKRQDPQDPLIPILTQCQAEEQAHRHQAIQEGTYGGIVKNGIKQAARLAIWLSEKW